jgi:hypothetical protein
MSARTSWALGAGRSLQHKADLLWQVDITSIAQFVKSCFYMLDGDSMSHHPTSPGRLEQVYRCIPSCHGDTVAKDVFEGFASNAPAAA